MKVRNKKEFLFLTKLEIIIKTMKLNKKDSEDETREIKSKLNYNIIVHSFEELVFLVI